MAVMILVDDEIAFEAAVRNLARQRECEIGPGREAAFDWLHAAYAARGMTAFIGCLPPRGWQLARGLLVPPIEDLPVPA